MASRTYDISVPRQHESVQRQLFADETDDMDNCVGVAMSGDQQSTRAVGHALKLVRNQASEMADVTVLENQRSAFSSLSHGDIHPRSGQVVGTNHLVGEQHPKCRINRPQEAIAEIGFSTRLHWVDVPGAEDVHAMTPQPNRQHSKISGPSAGHHGKNKQQRAGRGLLGPQCGFARHGCRKSAHRGRNAREAETGVAAYAIWND